MLLQISLNKIKALYIAILTPPMWRVFYSNFRDKTLIISSLDFIHKMNILNKLTQKFTKSPLFWCNS